MQIDIYSNTCFSQRHQTYRSEALRKNAGGIAPSTGCWDISVVMSTPLPGKLILFLNPTNARISLLQYGYCHQHAVMVPVTYLTVISVLMIRYHPAAATVPATVGCPRWTLEPIGVLDTPDELWRNCSHTPTTMFTVLCSPWGLKAMA